MLLGIWPFMYGIELLIADRAIIEAIAVYKPISIQFFPVFFLCFIYLLVKQTMPPKPLIFFTAGGRNSYRFLDDHKRSPSLRMEQNTLCYHKRRV